MKNIYRALMCIVALVAMQTASMAQIGYSITDNNRDATGLDQQYYAFDLATGQGTLLAFLTANGQPSGAGNPQIRREYEGLGSSGSILLGVAEFDTATCDNPDGANPLNDPLTGLSSDVRIFRVGLNNNNIATPLTYPVANGVPSAIGPQIGETCFPTGFTEAAAGYNAIDGFLYAIASDDTLPASAPRSRLFRVSTTNGLATPVGAGAAAAGIILTTGSGGDQNPYLDGLTVLPNGSAFATEARFTNNPVQDQNNNDDPTVGPVGTNDNGGLYRVFLTGPNAGRATFVSYLLPFDANRDTGLANNALGTVLFLLLEDARVYFLAPAGGSTRAVFPAGNPAGSNVLSTPGCLRPIAFPGQFCGDFEGFDVPIPAVR